MSERLVLDPTHSGWPRYTHVPSGDTCLRHPWMSDLEWMQAKAAFRRKHADLPVETWDGQPVRMLVDRIETEEDRMHDEHRKELP